MEIASMTKAAPTFENSRIALLALLLANLIPLLGVLYWGWSVFEIVLLYWIENLILGLITVLKMLTSQPDVSNGHLNIDIPAQGQRKIPVPAGVSVEKMLLGLKVFLIPFFIIHYGMFCMAHGTFVFALFSEEPFTGDLWTLDQLIPGPLLLVCGALLVSHLISFLLNYIGRGEYRHTNPMTLMMAPYQRIVVLHLTIILGAGLTLILGSPFWLLALLIGLKIFMDIRAHLQERNRFSQPTPETSAGEAIISNFTENGLKSRPS
jgi:hypothetical protein